MDRGWILFFYFFSSYIQSQTPIITHTSAVKTSQGRNIAYSETKPFNTARLPQQCIKLNGLPKQLRYISPISRKGHYIKVVSKNNTSEFIIRKEDCPEQLKSLLTVSEQTAFAHNKIVRIYHKNTNNNTWCCAATIPEQFATKIISKAAACPDGSIKL